MTFGGREYQSGRREGIAGEGEETETLGRLLVNQPLCDGFSQSAGHALHHGAGFGCQNHLGDEEGSLPPAGRQKEKKKREPSVRRTLLGSHPSVRHADWQFTSPRRHLHRRALELISLRRFAWKQRAQNPRVNNLPMNDTAVTAPFKSAYS